MGSGALADPDPWNASEQKAPYWPRQARLRNQDDVSMNGYTLEPHHRYDITALVLGRKDYADGPEARVSPTDLALGWGPLSSPAVLEGVTIRQEGRFYFFTYEGYIGLTKEEVIRYSANVHVIPGNPTVRERLRRTRPGDVIRLKGRLVDVRAPGMVWQSSRRRDDSGDGACEIILVDVIGLSPDRRIFRPVAPPDRYR